MTTYDRTRLKALGKRMQKLRKDQDELRPELFDEILAALDAGVSQADIVRDTGYTRDNVRQLVRRRTPPNG